MATLPRLLALPSRSFFVFGPRGVGKSTWLRQVLSRETPLFDLLRSDVFLDLVLGQQRTFLGLAARITDQPGASAHQNDWGVTAPLKVRQAHDRQ